MKNTPDFNGSATRLSGLFVFSVLISIIYIFLTYRPGFLSGHGPYWEMQVDDVGTYITGLRYYIRDSWHFPLFYTSTLQFPDGASIIFTDSLPLLAVAAKILYKMTGVEWNYFGHWFVVSNIFFGISIILFLDSLRIRSYSISAAALLFGFSVFPYISRTFHIALSSHFLIILALALYFRSQDLDRHKGSILSILILLIVSLLVHFYLFVICFLIAAVAIATLYLKKRLSFFRVMLYGCFGGVILTGVMFCSGHLSFDSSKSYVALGTAGRASMNVLSPVLPVHSSFFPAPCFEDPTGTQFFEGMNYLGLSVLILLLFLLIRYPKDIKRGLKNHPLLALLCFGLFIYSLSNKIYFGSHLVFEIPLVPGVETLYKTLKATARFFWPSVYLLTFLPVVVLWKKTSHPRILLLVLIALAVTQNIEVWPLRQEIRNRTDSSMQIEHASAYQSLVRDHDLILVDREGATGKGHYRDVVRSFYFLAGKEEKLINYCYTARRLRNSTALEALIPLYLDGEIPVLFVIPADSECTELLESLPYQLERDGVIYSSNQHELHID